jgi:uncharacterized membrane protein
MIQAVTMIERSIKDRRLNDVEFINWWLYFFIVNPITLGIYGIILFFKRTDRVDRFINRKARYYESLIDFTEKYCKEKQSYDKLHHRFNDLKSLYKESFSEKIKPVNSGLSFLLIIITLGIWSLIWLYKMNKVWFDLELFEQDFDDTLSQIWIEAGLTKYPINIKIDPSKNRSYALYLILSLLTFGIWFLVWDYKIHTDPENIFPEFHSVEDSILQTIRNAQ